MRPIDADEIGLSDFEILECRGSYKTALEMILKKIEKAPTVTPQEPKTGHWKLVQRGKAVDICCSKCEAVRIKGYAYNYTIEQLIEDLNEYLKKDDMRYCPNCGCRMIEPQESEE